MNTDNVLYYCVKLDEESKNALYEYAKDKIPQDWKPKFFCHHMTIMFRTDFAKNEELINWCETNIGQEAYLAGLELGISDKAFALMVGTNVPSANKLKHVTIAVNLNSNGKPVDSNFIKMWRPVDKTIVLKGRVEKILKNT